MNKRILGFVGSLSAFLMTFICTGSAFADVKKVEILDTELYNALKYCAEVTPTISDPAQYVTENFASAVVCPGLENAAFSDAFQTISFPSEEDFMAVQEIYLNSMGLKNVDELEKFEGASRIYVLNNEIEELNFLSGSTYRDPRDRQIYLNGNRLRKYPTYYDYTPFFSEDGSYAGLFGMIITVNAMVAGNQTIEDEYEGDSYEMLDFIAKVQTYFDFLSNPPVSDDEGENQMRQAVGAYYSSDGWIELENATLGDDRKSLIPIDKTEDMKISYCRTWEETMASPLFAGAPDDTLNMMVNEILRPFFDDSGVACVLRATIKSKNTAAPVTDAMTPDGDGENGTATTPDASTPGTLTPDAPVSEGDTDGEDDAEVPSEAGQDDDEYDLLVPNTGVGKDYVEGNGADRVRQNDISIVVTALFIVAVGAVIKGKK